MSMNFRFCAAALLMSWRFPKVDAIPKAPNPAQLRRNSRRWSKGRRDDLAFLMVVMAFTSVR